MSKANERQVGGEHYKSKSIQHWDLVAYNKMGYFEAQITRYITRWRKKNGLQDVEKAIHYHAKLCELILDGVVELPITVRRPRKLDEFMEGNPLSELERHIFLYLIMYTTMTELQLVGVRLQELWEKAKEAANVPGNGHS